MHDDALNGVGAWPLAFGGPMVLGYGAGMPAGTTATAPVTPASPAVTTASGPAKNVVFISWLILLVLLVLSHTFTFEMQE